MGVTNIDPEIETDLLRDLLLACCDNIKFTRMQDLKTKKGKPYGFVEFQTIEDCLRATRLLDELVIQEETKPIKLRAEEKFKNVIEHYLEHRNSMIQQIDDSVEPENVSLDEVIPVTKNAAPETPPEVVPEPARQNITLLLEKFVGQYGPLVSKTPTTDGITYLFEDGTTLADKADGSQVMKEASQGLIEVIQQPNKLPINTTASIESERYQQYNKHFKLLQTNHDDVPPLPVSRNPLNLSDNLLSCNPKSQLPRDNDRWLRISSILGAHKAARQLTEEKPSEKAEFAEKPENENKTASNDTAPADRRNDSRNRFNKKRENSSERFSSRYSRGDRDREYRSRRSYPRRRFSDSPPREKRQRSVASTGSDRPEKRRQRSLSNSSGSSSSRPQPRRQATRRTRYRRSSDDYHQRRDRQENERRQRPRR
eukprot:TRINITY_DN19287_c0_g1_i1.p1 TRINITY_DN19287_c0_g1~~TRINITY_DN19287_c0_g1_i1.p1  ORF type:complete len:462 (+),score=77.45 TRINITY_DN19287_c0_g1_i1:110-1387(+)